MSSRLAQGVKIPFKLEGITRVDDTPVHKALRETLANTLIHADYYEKRGVVIHRNPGFITFANPGNMRISIQDAVVGGISDPRNTTLVKLFNMLNIGERAGSGVPNIYVTWKNQGWTAPLLEEQFNPGRTILTLVFSPSAEVGGSAIETGGSAMDSNCIEKAIIEYLKENTVCKASDIAKIVNLKASRIRDYLSQLVAEGIIEAEGTNRYRSYRLNSKNL